MPAKSKPRNRSRARRAALPGGRELAATMSLLKAVAHESRLLVLITLNRLGPMSAGALQEICAIEQSSMSHQLGVLRAARLVTSERAGKQMIYSLVDMHVARIVDDALAHAGEHKKS